MTVNAQRSLRLIPRTDFSRLTGNRGEIFYDPVNNTLRVFDSQIQGGISLARADLVNITNAAFAAKAATAGVSGGVQSGVAGRIAYYPSTGTQVNDLTELAWTANTSTLSLTGTVNVTGQKNRIRFHWDTLADLTAEVSPVDYHGMVAHAHDPGKLYYAHAGAWVPVAAESSLPNTFSTIAIAGQTSVTADTTADTLTLVAGTGITLTTNASTDTITITGTASTGNITFAANTIDSTDSAAITVTPLVNFESDVVVGNELVFADGSRQRTSAVGIPGPQGDIGPPGASGAGTGDVLSAGGGYVDNRIVRYDGTTGTIIQVSSASVSDAGLLTATSFSGAGTLITALNATELTSGTVPDARFPATLPAVSGVNLTALNATQLTSGTVPNARFPATLPASSGVNLTALNATELTSGTVPDARFPAALPAVSGVNLTALPATLPASSGANLTALNATQLTSGTVPIGRLGSSGTPSGSTYLRGDNTWATVSGGSASDSFATIAVAGQSSVVADSATDTLTLVAGSNITITTDSATDTVTIAATGGAAANSFNTIAVAGQSDVVADTSTDTLTLAGGTGIQITTNSGTDTVTITSTVSAGATAFTGLTDRADLTVDKFYLPAITRLDVTNNGASSYRFDQYGTTDNPAVYAINGTTIAFNLNVVGHPFLIRTSGGSNYNTGLVHVSTTGTVLTGASAQGQTSGTLYWKIPTAIAGSYQYICSIHGAMVGVIEIKAFSAI
jgi:plastocyanin